MGIADDITRAFASQPIQADVGKALHEVFPDFCEKQVFQMYEGVTGEKSTMSYDETKEWLRTHYPFNTTGRNDNQG